MTSPVPHNPSQPPAGWYPHNGLTRWWDGTQWTEHVQQPYPQPQQPQMMQQPHQRMDGTRVHRDVTYTRPQTGHSLTKHLCLGIFVLWIPAIYYTCSPNHYWHA